MLVSHCRHSSSFPCECNRRTSSASTHSTFIGPYFRQPSHFVPFKFLHFLYLWAFQQVSVHYDYFLSFSTTFMIGINWDDCWGFWVILFNIICANSMEYIRVVYSCWNVMWMGDISEFLCQKLKTPTLIIYLKIKY